MIIVFLLPLAKIFVYECSENNKSDSQLMLEAELYYDYLKKYKPISIEKRYNIHDNLDIDKYVKLFMIKYGVDHVRGGSYSDEILSDSQLSILLCELETASDICKKRQASVNDLIQIYANNKMTKEEIMVEHQSLETTLATFKKDKREYESIQINGTQIIEHIQWIKFACSQIVDIYNTNKGASYLSRLVKKEFISKYKEVLVSLKTIYAICKEHNYSRYIYEVYIQFPQFLLDDFFYHLYRIHLTSYITQVEELCNSYEHMTNIIINKMDEKAFDVSTWGEDVEWRTTRALYLLDKIDSL